MTKRKPAAPLKPAPAIRNDIGKLQHDLDLMDRRHQEFTLRFTALEKRVGALLDATEALLNDIRFEPVLDCCTDIPGPLDKTREVLSKTNEPMKTFASGAVRGTDCMKARYDLINTVGLRRLAETYAEGSKKYGDSNWQKGIPSPDLMNHAETHIQAWKNGDTSEDHIAHAVWNLFTLMYTEERLPHLIIRPYAPGFDPNTDPTNVKLK